MCAYANRRELRNSGSAAEPSVPTSSSPRGRGGVHGCPMSGRAPDPKGPFDLGHQRNVSFISPTHSAELALRVSPPIPSGIRVRERAFEPSSDTVWVASPQRVPEPCPPRGRGGDAGVTTAGREKRHDIAFGL